MNLQLLPRSVHAHPHAAIEFPALIDGRALRVELDRSVMCRMLQVSDLTPDLVDAFFANFRTAIDIAIRARVGAHGIPLDRHLLLSPADFAVG